MTPAQQAKLLSEFKRLNIDFSKHLISLEKKLPFDKILIPSDAQFDVVDLRSLDKQKFLAKKTLLIQKLKEKGYRVHENLARNLLLVSYPLDIPQPNYSHEIVSIQNKLHQIFVEEERRQWDSRAAIIKDALELNLKPKIASAGLQFFRCLSENFVLIYSPEEGINFSADLELAKAQTADKPIENSWAYTGFSLSRSDEMKADQEHSVEKILDLDRNFIEEDKQNRFRQICAAMEKHLVMGSDKTRHNPIKTVDEVQFIIDLCHSNPDIDFGMRDYYGISILYYAAALLASCPDELIEKGLQLCSLLAETGASCLPKDKFSEGLHRFIINRNTFDKTIEFNVRQTTLHFTPALKAALKFAVQNGIAPSLQESEKTDFYANTKTLRYQLTTMCGNGADVKEFLLELDQIYDRYQTKFSEDTERFFVRARSMPDSKQNIESIVCAYIGPGTR